MATETKRVKLSDDSSPLERELGLREGMHGTKANTTSDFVKNLVASLGDNYIVFRSYNTEDTFDPKVVLCGENHTQECREELKQVVEAVIQPEDIVLLEDTNMSGVPFDDDPFKAFSGKVRKIEFNDNPMLARIQTGMQPESKEYIASSIKRNRKYFAPSIIQNVGSNPDSRIFQRIGHRHIIEWMEILQELEKQKIPYIAIVPKVNPGYTPEQNAYYNRLARTTSSVEF
ncbi:hypothetical protein KY326_03025 [Candidatus Woesearchaeota archaeon]|nr:hypothetical protein [Candidatus Woesearchaeota archaeon]